MLNNERPTCVVYGLGNNYTILRDEIESMYSVIAVSDRECKKDEFSNYVAPQILKDMVFDWLIVTIKDNGIMDYAKNVLKIPSNRIKLLDSPRITFHGQYYDDLYLAYIFRKIGYKETSIKYLELGVCDPIEISNTYFFYKNGSRGVLVDANPEVKPLVSEYRPEDIFYNMAVCGNTNKEDVEFFITENRGLCSLSKKCIEKSSKHNEGTDIIKSIRIQSISINQLLKIIGFCPDLVSMDIEGMDYTVLQEWDFQRFRPKVIIAELTDIITNLYMERKGYFLCTRQGSNSIFVDNVFAEMF